MYNVDRVAVVAVCWFVAWIAIGLAVGIWVGTPGTGVVSGFFFALLAVLAWPWIMPEAVNDWMDRPAGMKLARTRNGSQIAKAIPKERSEPGLERVALVAGCWFLFWMIVGSMVGGLTGGGHGGVQNGIYFGAFNGALWAVLTSFAWPWIMPESIQKWMDR